MKRHFIAILVATLLAAPAATATWRAMGTYEPDHPLDASGGFMYRNADQNKTGSQIFFNVVQHEFPLGVNPNSGDTGSRVVVAGAQRAVALFGPWKDCDGDGYIGAAKSGWMIYPAILADPKICPAGANDHNDGQWVYELIPIGFEPTDATQNRHARQIVDDQSLVWGDNGLPGESFPSGCPLTPFPHGTFSGTGHTIRFFDCTLNKRIQNNSDMATSAVDPDDDLGLRWDNYEEPQLSDSKLNQHYPVNLWGNPTKNQTGILQLDSNEDNPQGGNSKYQRDYAFTTWDRDANGQCNTKEGKYLVEIRSPTPIPLVNLAGHGWVSGDNVTILDPTYNQTSKKGTLFGNYGRTDENLTADGGRYGFIAHPDPKLRQTPRVEGDPTQGEQVRVHTGSVADGLNETLTGFRIGGGDDIWDTNVGGDCDLESDGLEDEDGESTYTFAHNTAFFRFDSPFEPASSIKKSPDHVFLYQNGGEMEGAMADTFGENAPHGVIGAGPIWYLGLSQAPAGQITGAPLWHARITTVTTPQSVNRDTAQPHENRTATYYARVGSATFDKGYTTPLGDRTKFATYGAEACTKGIKPADELPVADHKQNNWWCVPEFWYTDGSFNPIKDGNEVWVPRVGSPYQFRDVDCLDGTLLDGLNVQASLVALSNGSCLDDRDGDGQSDGRVRPDDPIVRLD